MDWRPIEIMEITLYLSKVNNWKSPGNDQIQQSKKDVTLEVKVARIN